MIIFDNRGGGSEPTSKLLTVREECDQIRGKEGLTKRSFLIRSQGGLGWGLNTPQNWLSDLRTASYTLQITSIVLCSMLYQYSLMFHVIQYNTGQQSKTPYFHFTKLQSISSSLRLDPNFCLPRSLQPQLLLLHL